MGSIEYKLVAEALANYKELNLFVNETKTLEEAKSILNLQGYYTGKIEDGQIGYGFSVRYRNIETFIYEYNGLIVADPYIDIYYNKGESVMEAMFIDDLEEGIYR